MTRGAASERRRVPALVTRESAGGAGRVHGLPAGPRETERSEYLTAVDPTEAVRHWSVARDRVIARSGACPGRTREAFGFQRASRSGPRTRNTGAQRHLRVARGLGRGDPVPPPCEQHYCSHRRRLCGSWCGVRPTATHRAWRARDASRLFAVWRPWRCARRRHRPSDFPLHTRCPHGLCPARPGCSTGSVVRESSRSHGATTSAA